MKNNFTRGKIKETLNIGESRMDPDIISALNRLSKSMMEDPGYFYTWQANIAMSFVDHIDQYKRKKGKKYLNRNDIHTVANDSAKSFLNLIMR